MESLKFICKILEFINSKTNLMRHKIVTAGNESTTTLQCYRDTQAIESILINPC